MEQLLAGVNLVLLVFLAWKANEANMRLKVMDMRIRVLERFIQSPKSVREYYKEIYDSIFGAEQISEYNKLLNFGRKHNLILPILTIEEEQEYVKNKKQREQVSEDVWKPTELP